MRMYFEMLLRKDIIIANRSGLRKISVAATCLVPALFCIPWVSYMLGEYKNRKNN